MVELRDLQERADALARDVAAMRARLERQSDLPRAVRGAWPGGVEDALALAARRIAAAAERLAGVRAARWAGPCTTWWGICPRCEQALRPQEGHSWCRRCGTGWDRPQGPCGEPAAFVAMDAMGGTVVVCTAHGRYLQDRLDGGLLLPVPAS
ncbi:hypothetical protein GCM10009665_28670 [Kitasatospora nipponensis]|uniref:Uncharacterized protein n=1 Tax=Kitasatospora nipponensis TaxID=258049 RepID=A0ABN1W6E7_9ACTN